MLLRFRGPDGTVRIIVEPADTFARLGEKVCSLSSLKEDVPCADSLQLSEVLPATVDFNTLTLSNAPAGGDIKLLKEIARHRVSQIGLG
jgi:nuclear protein localization family protein 4